MISAPPEPVREGPRTAAALHMSVCLTTAALSQGQMSSGASSAVSIQRRHAYLGSADTGGNSNVSGSQ